MTTNDGGPAFPSFLKRDEFGNFDLIGGMSIRDWFAGQALVALPNIGCGADLTVDEIPVACYQIADAMLAERAKGGAK